MNEPAAACYFPPRDRDTWELVSAGEVDWDPGLLEAVIEFAGASHSTGFIILHQGRILAERYWAPGGGGVPADVASAQKSVTSALIGIARQDGLLDLDQPSSVLLGEGWSGVSREREDRIMLRHHLSMTTGLTEDLAFEAEPGTTWAYNNRTYHILKDGLRRVTGRPLDEWSREVLWEPTGMRNTSWVTRVPPPGVPRNVFAFGPESAPFSALVTTVRDMARFGLLMANGGKWDGLPVVADGQYVAASVTSSQSLNAAYGYLWWVNTPGPFVLPIRQAVPAGPFIPAAPGDLFCALGFGDQKIYVSPSLGLVIARQGQPAGEPGAARSGFDQQLWAKLMAAAGRSGAGAAPATGSSEGP